MKTRKQLIESHRIVIKIGSSSLTHATTRELDYQKLEKLVRVLCDLKNMGKEVVLVSSGAQAVGRKEIGYHVIPNEMPKKQALAAIGQAKLMMTYQRLFSQYSQMTAQILITKNSFINALSRSNALNTFNELLAMGVIPVVNENDTVSTLEIEFGDNDHLSAYVSQLIKADALVMLSDIEGLFTADPRTDKSATLIDYIETIDEKIEAMAQDTLEGSLGTGGMKAKVDAARIATQCGTDTVIASGASVDILYDIFAGEKVGTYFKGVKTS